MRFFEICDEISVLRDGNLVMTKSTKDANMNELIAAMVGRSLDNRFPPVDNTPGDVILSIQNLSTKFEPHLQDVSFDVKRRRDIRAVRSGRGRTYGTSGNNLWCPHQSRRTRLF